MILQNTWHHTACSIHPSPTSGYSGYPQSISNNRHFRKLQKQAKCLRHWGPQHSFSSSWTYQLHWCGHLVNNAKLLRYHLRLICYMIENPGKWSRIYESSLPPYSTCTQSFNYRSIVLCEILFEVKSITYNLLPTQLAQFGTTQPRAINMLIYLYICI